MVVFGIIVQAHDVMLQKYTIFAEGEVAEVILEQILNFFTGADYGSVHLLTCEHRAKPLNMAHFSSHEYCRLFLPLVLTR